MISSKKFTRKIEDFACEHCGREVVGNGYTNHCPACLWSKHVDKNPGDREESCMGLMKPVGGEKKGQGYMIRQVCERCGFERKATLLPQDDFDMFIKISRQGF